MTALSVKGKKHVRKLRGHVFAYLVKRNGKKYKSFLRYLRFFKYAALSPNRGDFLQLYYVLMRYLDDVADGDLPIPNQYKSRADYIQSKIDFLHDTTNPSDDIDFLMLHCFELARKFNADFTNETQDILTSLLFDARRFGTSKIFPHDELMKHFHLMDIRGTIRATLKIFKDDPENYVLLEPLGMATRIHYDLHDFEADIRNGYVNIPLEEIIELNINISEVTSRHSPNVYQWFIKQAKRGLELLDDHQGNLKKGKFTMLARATFPWVYVHPASRYFKQVLLECPDELKSATSELRLANQYTHE